MDNSFICLSFNSATDLTEDPRGELLFMVLVTVEETDSRERRPKKYFLDRKSFSLSFYLDVSLYLPDRISFGRVVGHGAGYSRGDRQSGR